MTGKCSKCGKEARLQPVEIESIKKWLCDKCIQELTRYWEDWYSK